MCTAHDNGASCCTSTLAPGLVRYATSREDVGRKGTSRHNEEGRGTHSRGPNNRWKSCNRKGEACKRRCTQEAGHGGVANRDRGPLCKFWIGHLEQPHYRTYQAAPEPLSVWPFAPPECGSCECCCQMCQHTYHEVTGFVAKLSRQHADGVECCEPSCCIARDGSSLQQEQSSVKQPLHTSSQQKQDAQSHAKCGSNQMLGTCRQLFDGPLHASHGSAAVLMLHMLWQSPVDTLVLQMAQANHAMMQLLSL